MNNINNFDPNAIGLKDTTIFGLPYNESNAELILIPVPWEVTVSYRGGTAAGPELILEESLQIDLYDSDAINAWQKGYYMLPIDKSIEEKSKALKSKAHKIIQALEEGIIINENKELNALQKKINEESNILNDWLYKLTKEQLNQGKKVALIGGDHSTPFGFIKALAEKYEQIGILQIDAHADLRIAYEGFKYSHASIMYNVLNEIPNVTKLIQIGIRDYCDEEMEIIKSNDKIKTYFDSQLKNEQYEGKTWAEQVNEIIKYLPSKLYISFDIDGLDPKLCPNTGTPVPGGFELQELFYLFNKIKEANIEIIAFDVNEVSSGSNQNTIDPIVGARAIYKLCNLMMK